VSEPFPGVRVRTFDSERATVTLYAFAAGAAFPSHHHPQEQITLVEEGELAFVVDGEVGTVRAGDWRLVPPGRTHEVTAGPEGARLISILVPRRGAGEIAMDDPGRG